MGASTTRRSVIAVTACALCLEVTEGPFGRNLIEETHIIDDDDDIHHTEGSVVSPLWAEGERPWPRQ